MKQFLSLADVEDLKGLVKLARERKADPWSDRIGEGRKAVLLFLNPSLRTRLSTQVAARHLGMECIVMNAGQDGWQLEFVDGAVMDGIKAEHVREAAAVISQYADVIGLRTFAGLTDRNADDAEEILTAFCRYATVPVVNMESATTHPLQSLTDLITIEEYRRIERPKVVLTWAPHPKALPQAVANSFAEWVNAWNAELVIAHPPGYELAERFTGKATITHDQRNAFSGADFVYAKNWSSYQHYGKVLETGREWTVTVEKMALTNQAYFMHCLPVRRNVVVEDAVLDSDRSLVIPQAGNRVWAAQAVFHRLLSER